MMKKQVSFTIILFLSLTFCSFELFISTNHKQEWKEKESPNGDWFYRQRSYPHSEINYEQYRQAFRQSATMNIAAKAGTKNASAAWQFAGPVNIGGRITDIEMPSDDQQTIYAGAASGGVFKSTNFGDSWLPIFDETGSFSIGDIAIDPSHANNIYVGTGEPNGGSGSLTYGGFGVYKSTDAGSTWLHLGLDSTRFIGKVAVAATDSQRILVGAMGTLFSPNPNRGVYRSTNGGTSWEKVFFLTDSTGCIDIAINTRSADTVYAAMFERTRMPWGRTYGGITSGLYRSTDGGTSWAQLTNGLPPNSESISRITIAMFPANPKIIFASYTQTTGELLGVYKTTDGGDSWNAIGIAGIEGIYYVQGYWYGGIKVHPTDQNILYILGLDVAKTTDGGTNWNAGFPGHVDHHTLFIHPQNPSLWLEGNDGGLYYSTDAGTNFTQYLNLPVTQFYTCDVDNSAPERLYGGTQDNGSNRTVTGALDDWQNIWGGDGFYNVVDPADNNFIYSESQYCGFAYSTDGGSSFFSSGLDGVDFNDRFNWNTPIVLDPTVTSNVYIGSQKVYKSANRGITWDSISPDLSNGPSPGNLLFGTITSIAVSQVDGNIIYAGCDDGNVWMSSNGGTNWNHLSDSLPHRWVTRVQADPINAQTAYVTFSGYRWNESVSHIYRTTNFGVTWKPLSGNLPDAPVNDVIVDPLLDSVLYAATDVGVFVTYNLGRTWSMFGTNLPGVVVNDLVLHNDTRTLVAATYGRSMYKLSVDDALRVKETEYKVSGFNLLQNYPNPFNPVTTIAFSLPHSSFVSLTVFDINGREVSSLISKRLSAGKYEIPWNAAGYSSGIYFYKLTADEYIQTKKLVLLK